MITLLMYITLFAIAYYCVSQANAMTKDTCNIRKACLVAVIIGSVTVTLAVFYKLQGDDFLWALLPLLIGVLTRMACDRMCLAQSAKAWVIKLKSVL
jgi:uncharacterized protein (DUF983 family)